MIKTREIPHAQLGSSADLEGHLLPPLSAAAENFPRTIRGNMHRKYFNLTELLLSSFSCVDLCCCVGMINLESSMIDLVSM